ncbi:putative dye-decolorizing peroxidase (DyP)YfeX-like subgroup [Salmonella enterica subsp. diarizonae]|uniref:Putative dye-decolorizing peroxidase (DyP)YfeX-like subgroup n=1 Tax=Salmonella diarizonae TaxID=59204 RepID=A0A379TWZ1_SALDZ|nr:putative dye-decolorizing peroxidase (DyP)YfeX-like subgroup [Salmonella enterica subsp. diarizonae]
MSQVQSGILPEHCRAAIWIEANVKGNLDACARPAEHLPINWRPSKSNFRTPILGPLWRLATTPGAP